jgi:hypothetical protein
MRELFAGLSILAGVALVGAYAYNFGRLRAYKEGYTQGRKDADNWWQGVESEVDRERVKIWREEA